MAIRPKPRTRPTGLAGLTNLSVLAPLRTGLVPGFEPISYVERLRKVLDALQSARQNLRESELLGSFFPDVIGRLGIIHGFRYALVAPDSVPGGLPADFGTWRLSLNVSFDGGWEPYMRVIYRDIGTLLDLLFCHSPDYPGARTSSFEDYCDWVRQYEVPSGLFYADSSLTLGDQHYLQAIEKAQREQTAGDRELAQISLPSGVELHKDAMKAAQEHPEQALVLPLRTLKGLYHLAGYFPRADAPDEGELGVLRRFAQSVLREPIGLMKIADSLPVGDPVGDRWRLAKEKLYRDELEWLQWQTVENPPRPLPAVAVTSNMQSHILSTGEQMTHGCVVLLRITDARQVPAAIAKRVSLCGPVLSAGIVGYLFAFTYQGLKKLGIADQRLDALPQEFVQGMEARCALLGDVRSNHPDRWSRPPQWEQDSSQRVDLKTVHLVVHLRLAADPADGFGLHPKLLEAVRDLEDRPGTEATGLRVVAVEPLRSMRKPFGGVEQVAGHFGIADGISQPQLRTTDAVAERKAYSDLVSPGELLLGQATDRGDRPNAAIEPLLRDGTFLVVRKLRQHLDHLAEVFQGRESQRDALMEKMIGRKLDGKPLVAQPPGATDRNDFNFENRAASEGCPFHSHIRRANPRDGRSYTPRIVRRGMSYGPTLEMDARLDADRGVMFMAYCASISEQFEVIQRWIAGGNSSGVGSAQADPLLRVPRPGQPDVFRYSRGLQEPDRLDLGDKPLVQLQWGLYAFVPSLAALRALADYRLPSASEKAADPPPPDPEEADRERVREMLEDRNRSGHAWELVRNGDKRGPQGRAYGTLLGKADEVLRALKDDGTQVSVGGYAQRMGDSLGLNLLGLDPGAARDKLLPVNGVIAEVGEREAFETTQKLIGDVMAQFIPLPSIPGDVVRRPVDLVNYSDGMMAALCREWFGPPDGSFMVPGGRVPDNTGTPRCPGDVNSPSRYIFSPHPRPPVMAEGRERGQALRKAVDDWLAKKPTLPPLARKIEAALATTHSEAELAATLVGLILGFTPTVQGNFLRVLETWIHEEESLWEQQQLLFERSPGPVLTYEEANAALRAPLFAALRKHPVPDMLWRSPVHGGQPDLQARHRLVLGMRSALTEPEAPDELVFGRDDRYDRKSPTVHGCPGYAMGMGILLAMIGGLLKAGTLRPTGSPVLLILTPNR